MPVPKYGVLAGRVSERQLASGSSNHYEIHVQAAGEDFRIAVNVQSVDGSEVLFHVDDAFDHPVTAALAALAEGIPECLIVDLQMAESQVYGALIMGIAYSLTEERILDPKSGRYINADLVKTVTSPETTTRLSAVGIEPTPGTPEQFTDFVRADLAKWARVVKEAGIPAE